MSTRPSSDGVLFNHISADPRENALEVDDGGSSPIINDVESIRRAIVKTSKNKANTPYTILLIGETGVGKSSVLEFIANVFAGNVIDHYTFDVLDYTNEQGGSNKQSQTNSARLYELTSKNGIAVRILDTPGLADTRDLKQDELHKQSIEAQIKNHIGSINAILVLANGTVPRVTVGTNDALTTLSAIFSKFPSKNIAFILTNTLNPLFQNFVLPGAFQGAPQFLFNNPFALQKKYLRLKGDPNVKTGREGFRNAVKVAEENALEMLVELLDWLDGLELQPTTNILPLYDKSRRFKPIVADNRDLMGQTAAQEASRSGAVNQNPTSTPTPNKDTLVSQAQMMGLLKKAKEKIQERIWKVVRLFFGK